PRAAPLCPYTTLFRSRGGGHVRPYERRADGESNAGRAHRRLTGRRAHRRRSGGAAAPSVERVERGSLRTNPPKRAYAAECAEGRSEEHTSELQSRENL